MGGLLKTVKGVVGVPMIGLYPIECVVRGMVCSRWLLTLPSYVSLETLFLGTCLFPFCFIFYAAGVPMLAVVPYQLLPKMLLPAA